MNDIKNQIDIVLVETSHPGNIGSVARAMKTMGLKNLILVNPKDFPSKDAFVLSGNAQDVIEQAIVVKTLDEAIKESTNIYATSARTRTISWPIITADEAGIEINNNVKRSSKTSIIFGREDRGIN
jgi:tRNA (cytidine32/uridine32-2'-O)-methyltransferase